MANVLNGATAMSCLAVGLFFVRFWRESNDRLFLCLAVAFAVFAMNYAVLGFFPLADERRVYAFALRLVGFVAILAGLMWKNREMREYLKKRDRELY
jgi:hypothetical protein